MDILGAHHVRTQAPIDIAYCATALRAVFFVVQRGLHGSQSRGTDNSGESNLSAIMADLFSWGLLTKSQHALSTGVSTLFFAFLRMAHVLHYWC
ncbi:MAG: hypothetical protein CMN21_02535 [Rubinisphaera sp.]|nr:hypothetical protein [Rubinisphaera sp.]